MPEQEKEISRVQRHVSQANLWEMMHRLLRSGPPTRAAPARHHGVLVDSNDSFIGWYADGLVEAQRLRLCER
jgi:hypothetical protein